jgi:hypothetical protein
VTTTKDEALDLAFDAYLDPQFCAADGSAVAAFLASLRESGWTLAPVEAETREHILLKAVHFYAGLFNPDTNYVAKDALKRCNYPAAQEDESNG